MAEMELVGEALPSMLAKAGGIQDTNFTMSLYCSKVRVCYQAKKWGTDAKLRYCIPVPLSFVSLMSLCMFCLCLAVCAPCLSFLTTRVR